MEAKIAGLKTETLSCIASSGKGGWFNRVSKRQFPELRLSPADVIKHNEKPNRYDDQERLETTPKNRRDILKTFRRINYRPANGDHTKPSFLLTKSISPERQKIITFYNNQDTKKNLFTKVMKVDEKKISDLCLRDSCNFSKASKTLTSGFESIKSFNEMKKKEEYYKSMSDKQADTLRRSQKVSIKNRMSLPQQHEYFNNMPKAFNTINTQINRNKYYQPPLHYELSRDRDEKSKVIQQFFNNQTPKSLSYHENKFKDNVINQQRFMSEDRIELHNAYINSTIRTFLSQHKYNNDKDVFD